MIRSFLTLCVRWRNSRWAGNRLFARDSRSLFGMLLLLSSALVSSNRSRCPLCRFLCLQVVGLVHYRRIPTANNRTGGCAFCRRIGPCNLGNHLKPPLGIRRRVRLEREFRSTRELAAHALGLVLALDVELVSTGGSNGCLREVDRKLWDWVLGRIAMTVLVSILCPSRGCDRKSQSINPPKQIPRNNEK